MAIVTIQQANEYFDARLHADVWDQASSADKQKALAQAGRDIGTVQMAKSPPSAVLIAAICEQVLFLLGKTTADLERTRIQQTGVKFRGVGDAREDYTGAYAHICSEAIQFIGPYIQAQRKFGGIR